MWKGLSRERLGCRREIGVEKPIKIAGLFST